MMVLFYGLMPVLIISRDIRIIAFAFFPLAELILVTKFRDKIDRPRPFGRFRRNSFGKPFKRT